MNKWDLSDLENMINNSVNNAFNMIDDVVIKAEELRDNILNTSNSMRDNILNTTNSVKNNIKNNTKDLNEKMERIKREQNIRKAEKIKEKDLKRYIAKGTPGNISGFFLTAIGGVATAIFGASTLFALFDGFMDSGIHLAAFIIMVMFLAGSIKTLLKGNSLRNRAKRFKAYVKCLRGREYCRIEEFAQSVGKKKKFVVKDLNKMIDAGLFKEAAIDDKQEYFMLGKDVYEQYMMAEKAYEQRQADEEKRQKEYEEAQNDPSKTKFMETVDTCRNYIKEIKEANDAIPDEEFSAKLDRMQRIVTEILNCIEKNPGKLNEVNKFTNHYLPITLKLVTSYRDLSRQEVEGANINAAKHEIENSIDVINKAFEKLLDDLFEDMALDISTDISVLKTLFTQDGLTKKDFEK